jgi:lipoprotein signal peptidase
MIIGNKIHIGSRRKVILGSKLKQFAVENLIINGDYTDGINNWIIGGTGSSISVSDGVAQIYGRYNGFSVYHNANIISGHIYYYRFKCKNIDAGITAALAVLKSGFGNGRDIIQEDTYFNLINVSTYNLVSFIVTANANYTTFNLHEMSSSVIQSALYDDVMVIDLSTVFGAGNEPSKEKCDLIFADYWEGSKKIYIPNIKITSPEMLTILTNMTNNNIVYPTTVTINGYEDYANPPQYVIDAVALFKTTKSVTTVNLRA